MPGQVTAADVLEMTHVGEADGQSVYNVMHYIVDPGLTPANTDIDPICAALVAGWEEFVLPVLSETYEYKEGRMQQIISVVDTTPEPVEGCPPPEIQFETIFGAWSVAFPGSPTPIGGKIGPALPTYGAAGCTKLSTKRGKYWRGAMRLGPIPEAETEAADQNKLVNQYEKDIETALGQYLAVRRPNEEAPDTMSMVIFSKTRAARFGGEAMSESTSAVTGINVRELVTSQVSRKRVRRVL